LPSGGVLKGILTDLRDVVPADEPLAQVLCQEAAEFFRSLIGEQVDLSGVLQCVDEL
jgi:hypothetical protein